MKQSLGVCYYPEHWDQNIWEKDAQQMKELGLSWVRIGEFAWKEIEPTEGQFNFEWLDKAIKILGQAGLKVVLGTPTATPPKWVLDKYPDMLSKDINGNIRGFGSRRHYCFSHSGYIEQCKDIVTRLAKRYGKNHMYVLGKLITSMDVTIPQFRILILLKTLSEPGLDTNILAKGMTEILKHLIRSGEMYSGQ